MQAVMMVAGKSTRTYPLTLTRPKPLLPIINRPMIYFNLDQMVGLVDEVILIVGYKKEMIEALIGHEYRGMSIIYQEQTQQLGTGHAVLQAAPHISDRFIVINGDDLFAHIDMVNLSRYSYAALVMKAPNPEEFGVVTINTQGHLEQFVEKPQEWVSDLVNVGCYIFEPAIFKILENLKPSVRGEIELPDAVLATTKNEIVQVVSLEGYWLPTGFPWYMLTTEKHLYDHYNLDYNVEGTIESGASITGKVAIGSNTIVKSGATINGPASIGANCVVEPGAVIQPYSSIGDNALIGENSRVEGSILFRNVRLEAHADVQYSVVGEGCVVGAGSKLLSEPASGYVQSMIKGTLFNTGMERYGATLADGVRLGKGVKIEPGVKIWPDKIVESEAELKNDITD